jgi:hypothetical protein
MARATPSADSGEVLMTTTESLRRGASKVLRITTCVILGLSATLIFAEDRSPIRATHILGLEGVSNNAGGNISIQENAFRFRRGEGSGAQVSVGSIVDVSLGEQDKQVGGVPMALGRAAAPFGGGRVIGLFSHKKYDTLTVEYLDTNGGFHGAIFQLEKGKAQVIRAALLAGGAHFAQPGNHATTTNVAEPKNDNK